jgi:glycosyltransferase involved in cell wall biosynthesis
MNKYASLVLPSSEFSREIFEANGVDPAKMYVLPHGFDPNVYNPSIAAATIKGLDQNKFKFLTVAISHWRKGYDLLLQAYIEEFKNDDSVVLIIKTGRDANEKPMPVHVDLQQIISGLRTTHNYKWPEIRLIETRFDNLARLYNACDAVVLPTRTECFSLTVLEAAACNRPIITTNYGGHLDFLNANNSWLIDYSMRQAPEAGQYWDFNPAAQCAEPSVEHLKHLMRTVKNNYTEAQNKAQLAYEQVTQKFTWKQVVDNLIKEANARNIPL